MAKYGALANRNDHTFVPFVVESTGALGPRSSAEDFLAQLAQSSLEPLQFLTYAKRRLAMAIQRGYALFARDGERNMRELHQVRLPNRRPRARQARSRVQYQPRRPVQDQVHAAVPVVRAASAEHIQAV